MILSKRDEHEAYRAGAERYLRRAARRMGLPAFDPSEHALAAMTIVLVIEYKKYQPAATSGTQRLRTEMERVERLEQFASNTVREDLKQ